MKKILISCMCAVCALAVFPTVLMAQVNLNKGLVAYYPFNGNAVDATGNGYNGSFGSDVTLSTDRYGRANKAYNFSGGQGISVSPFSNTGGPTGGTMSFWMKSTSTAQYVQMVWGVPGTIWLNLFTTGHYVGVYDGVAGSHSSSNESKSTVNDGNWYNLTSTNDGSTTRVYVNGVLENTYSDVELKTSVGLVIGAYNSGYNVGYSGKLDDVRIYFRQLSDSEVMAVYQMPLTAFGFKNVCLNDSMHFSDSSIAVKGSKYAWSFGDGISSVTTSPAHLYAKAGNYNVTLKITSPYGSVDSITKTVTVINSPAQPTITQSGHLLLASSGVAYQWYRNDSLIKGATLAYYQPTVNKGSFSVSVTDSGGCSNTSSAFDYDITAIDEQEIGSHLTIYPNPAHDYLNIDLGSATANIQSLQITDMNGRCLKTLEHVSGNGTIKVSTGDMAKGMYFIKLKGKENTFIRKVVIE